MADLSPESAPDFFASSRSLPARFRNLPFAPFTVFSVRTMMDLFIPYPDGSEVRRKMDAYNLLIHDLPFSPPPAPPGWRVVNALTSSARCQGCFGCWLKTPGECVLKDSLQEIGAEIGQCDRLAIVSRAFCGGFSPEVKRALDRSNATSLPFFTYRGWRLHHFSRYGKRPSLEIWLYGDMTEQEKETC